eukprot:m.17657 g.17657  ORF g.17657 m.17657 type:complete len:73 (+) comp10687_c0_seq2:205-423(+)
MWLLNKGFVYMLLLVLADGKFKQVIKLLIQTSALVCTCNASTYQLTQRDDSMSLEALAALMCSAKLGLPLPN